jgi:hypothetical protein
MNLSINIFFSFIEFLAGLSLADVLFRLPFEHKKRLKHVLISLFLAFESGYFSTYWDYPLLTFMFTLFLWIISLVVFFQISIWYSMLIGIISGLLGAALELIGYMVGNVISTINLHEISEFERNIVLFCVSVVLYGLSIFISRKKFGFLIPNIYSKPPLNKLFFIVSSTMIASMLVTSYLAFYFKGQVGIIHFSLVALILVCIFLIVYFTYKYNKRLLKDKYNRGGQSLWG